MLEATRRSSASDWLTVEEIATELNISRSVVYRLIRNGELEAVDLVDTNGKIARKGHYRISMTIIDVPCQPMRCADSWRLPAQMAKMSCRKTYRLQEENHGQLWILVDNRAELV
jgi:excisionase family DNA binding protein